MTPTQIERLAQELMQRHGLVGWAFGWDRALRRFGCCHPAQRKITMSRVLSPKRTDVEVEQTLLHEIAHGLVGVGHGHDRVWLQKAREIGYTGGRCGTDTSGAALSTAKYVGTCKGCQRQYPRHRAAVGTHVCQTCWKRTRSLAHAEVVFTVNAA